MITKGIAIANVIPISLQGIEIGVGSGSGSGSGVIPTLSITGKYTSGTLITPSNGWVNGFNRAQGIYYDRHDNLWLICCASQTPLGGG